MFSAVLFLIGFISIWKSWLTDWKNTLNPSSKLSDLNFKKWASTFLECQISTHANTNSPSFFISMFSPSIPPSLFLNFIFLVRKIPVSVFDCLPTSNSSIISLNLWHFSLFIFGPKQVSGPLTTKHVRQEWLL